MGISGEVGEREVRYPSTVTYQGGLYYEYLGGRLVYVRVSEWGDGPNIIYGMRQGVVGRVASGVRNGTGASDENMALLQEVAGSTLDTAR